MKPTIPKRLNTADRVGPNDAAEYDEESIPFDLVIRKLANTKPPHKAVKVPKAAKPAKTRANP